VRGVLGRDSHERLGIDDEPGFSRRLEDIPGVQIAGQEQLLRMFFDESVGVRRQVVPP